MEIDPTQRLAIFVPQGAEYQGICRGLKPVKGNSPTVFAIPAGVLPLRRYLSHWLDSHAPQDYPQALLMGLCGSLSPDYQIGDAVLYGSCLSPEEPSPQRLTCDDGLLQSLHRRLSLPIVQGITRDRVITTATEKQALYRQYQADVVDMEGYVFLETLNPTGIKTAMVRTVSDDCHRDIPSLDAAFDEDGHLQPLALVLSLIRQPLAAARFMRDATQGLQALEKITTALFLNPTVEKQ